MIPVMNVRPGRHFVHMNAGTVVFDDARGLY